MGRKRRLRIIVLPRRYLAAALGLLLAAIMLAGACLPELLLTACLPLG